MGTSGAEISFWLLAFRGPLLRRMKTKRNGSAQTCQVSEDNRKSQTLKLFRRD
jgi:hypothetical protein